MTVLDSRSLLVKSIAAPATLESGDAAAYESYESGHATNLAILLTYHHFLIESTVTTQ